MTLLAAPDQGQLGGGSGDWDLGGGAEGNWGSLAPTSGRLQGPRRGTAGAGCHFTLPTYRGSVPVYSSTTKNWFHTQPRFTRPAPGAPFCAAPDAEGAGVPAAHRGPGGGGGISSSSSSIAGDSAAPTRSPRPSGRGLMLGLRGAPGPGAWTGGTRASPLGGRTERRRVTWRPQRGCRGAAPDGAPGQACGPERRPAVEAPGWRGRGRGRTRGMDGPPGSPPAPPWRRRGRITRQRLGSSGVWGAPWSLSAGVLRGREAVRARSLREKQENIRGGCLRGQGRLGLPFCPLGTN